MSVFGWIALGLAAWLAVSVGAGLLLGLLLGRRAWGFAGRAGTERAKPVAAAPPARRRAA